MFVNLTSGTPPPVTVWRKSSLVSAGKRAGGAPGSTGRTGAATTHYCPEARLRTGGSGDTELPGSEMRDKRAGALVDVHSCPRSQPMDHGAPRLHGVGLTA